MAVLAGLGSSLLQFRGALLAAMVARGHAVTAVAPDADAQVVESLARLGVDYRRVPLRRAAIDPVGDLATLLALARLFRDIRPDVLLAYTIKPVIWGSLAARLAGVAGVNSMITGLGFAFGEGGGPRQRLVNLAARRLYKEALAGNRRVLFQNPDDQVLFTKHGLLRDAAQAVLVNGSGIDLELFRQAEPVLAPRFLMAARLIVAKGVRDYVQAGRLLRRRYPSARLRLAGDIDGASRGPIKHCELAAWAAAGEVDPLGWVADIRPAMAECAVYVLPSYREGTPRSVLEAMAMGRPIVTTDVPGCRETVLDGVNGFLVPPRDPPALAGALARFVEEPALIVRMGAASRRLAETKYDVRTVNGAILDALEL